MKHNQAMKLQPGAEVTNHKGEVMTVISHTTKYPCHLTCRKLSDGKVWRGFFDEIDQLVSPARSIVAA